MTWQDVQALRKSGRFREALDAGMRNLQDTPDDFLVRGQVDWSYYGLIKQLVGEIAAKCEASKPIPKHEVDALHHELRCYAKLPKRRPDKALSLIVHELAKVAPHFPPYPGVVRWVGIDGLAEEDWQYQKRDEKTFPPLALKVARGLARWLKERPEAPVDDVGLALTWLERARSAARGDDALWIDWDSTSLLRRADKKEQAAAALARVIRAKRQEFWVWAEAARLHQDERPELAIACACRALECGSDPKFLVKVHLELAQMLARREEYAQASREASLAAEIRQKEGWKIDAPLQALMDSGWYDPKSSAAEEPREWYARHSPQALILCYDEVTERPATFLGVIVPAPPKGNGPHRKPRPLSLFAVRDDEGEAVSLVFPGLRGARPEPGEPITVVLGKDATDGRETIVRLSPRPDGAQWDCTDEGTGVVVRAPDDGRRGRLFVGRDDADIDFEATAWMSDDAPAVGQGVRLRLAVNPKTGRRDVFGVLPGPLPQKDVREVRGRLRRNPKGFAFIGDVFVAPNLVAEAGETDTVSVLAVYGRHPAKDGHGWRALSICATKSERGESGAVPV